MDKLASSIGLTAKPTPRRSRPDRALTLTAPF